MYPGRESSETVLFRQLSTPRPQRPPTGLTHRTDHHTKEGESDPLADFLSTEVEQSRTLRVAAGWATLSPSCAPPSGYSATPSRPMWLQAWDSSPTPIAQPLPHSLLTLQVPRRNFLLTALALPFGPAFRLVPRVPPPASGTAQL